jgi:hypothetical protein
MNPPETVSPVKEDRFDHLDAYVNREVGYLKKRAKMWEILAVVCYSFCALVLFTGVVFALFRAVMSSVNTEVVPKLYWVAPVKDGLGLGRSIASSLIVLALLVAMARFWFVMGKSCMVESIRNSNRRHAISFGQFYLRAFHDQVTWPDAKDAFRAWNIDIGSWFLKQNADDIDPQLLEHVEAMLVAVANTARGNK